MQAMIFAAGLGTRLQPLTNNTPKALVELNKKTLLQRSIENLQKQGCTRLVINVHHFSNQVIQFLREHQNFGMEILISDESEELLDTGGGLWKAQSLFNADEPILLINVDVLTNLSFKELINYHEVNQSMATLVVRQRTTSRYLLFDEQQQLCGWKNIKNGATKVSRLDSFEAATPYAFSGIHIVQPSIFQQIEASGKFSIIELYLKLAQTQKVKAFIDSQSLWMDLGKFEQVTEAEELIKAIDNNKSSKA